MNSCHILIEESLILKLIIFKQFQTQKYTRKYTHKHAPLCTHIICICVWATKFYVESSFIISDIYKYI